MVTGYFGKKHDVTVYGTTLAECRKKCVSALRKNKDLDSMEVYKENARDGYVGWIYLNWNNMGVFVVGRTVWMVDKNGKLYDKGPFGLR